MLLIREITEERDVVPLDERLRSKGPKPRRRTDGFYHSTRWRKLRRYALSRDPLCRDPFGEHAEWSEVVSATEVDHIVPRRVRPELELALENLQALCKRCHSRKTKAESQGKCYAAQDRQRPRSRSCGHCRLTSTTKPWRRRCMGGSREFFLVAAGRSEHARFPGAARASCLRL